MNDFELDPISHQSTDSHERLYTLNRHILLTDVAAQLVLYITTAIPALLTIFQYSFEYCQYQPIGQNYTIPCTNALLLCPSFQDCQLVQDQIHQCMSHLDEKLSQLSVLEISFVVCVIILVVHFVTWRFYSVQEKLLCEKERLSLAASHQFVYYKKQLLDLSQTYLLEWKLNPLLTIIFHIFVFIAPLSVTILISTLEELNFSDTVPNCAPLNDRVAYDAYYYVAVGIFWTFCSAYYWAFLWYKYKYFIEEEKKYELCEMKLSPKICNILLGIIYPAIAILYMLLDQYIF